MTSIMSSSNSCSSLRVFQKYVYVVIHSPAKCAVRRLAIQRETTLDADVEYMLSRQVRMVRAAPLPSYLKPYGLDDLEMLVVPVAIESYIGCAVLRHQRMRLVTVR